jgi:hypothetical protein
MWCNNRTTVERGVFYAVSAKLYNEKQLRLREILETAVRTVGGRCEMAASLRVSQLE